MTKRYKIPSRSEPSKYRIITVDGDQITCDCPANKNQGDCWHIRLYKKWAGEVKGNPDHCFYTHDERKLTEHHLLRGSERRFSLTIWVTDWIHRLATEQKDFEKHLVDLFINSNQEIMEIKFIAKVKEISIRNLVSMDKGLQIEIQSENIGEAMKLAQLTHEKLIKVNFRKESLFATIDSVKKTNLKKEDLNRVQIVLSSAPAELMNVAALGLLPLGEEIEVEYNKVGQ